MRRPSRGVIALALLLHSAAAVAASGWSPSERLVDARFGEVLDLTTEAARGDARLELGHPLIAEGRPIRALRVGSGWIELLPGSPQADAPPPLRLEAAGTPAPGVPSRVLASSDATGTIVRFLALPTAEGDVTAELLLSPGGSVTRQVLQGPGAPRSWRRDLGRPIALPPVARSGEPTPPGCDPEGGTWCDRADGPGDLALFLDETFDDGRAPDRGWSASGEWRPSDPGTCGNGASGDGRAFHFGDPVTCQYRARSTGMLESPRTAPLSPRAELRFHSRLDAETRRDGSPADVAEILVNGEVAATLPGDLDPSRWHAFTVGLGAWAGRSVRIGFRFTADGRNQGQGWFVDDVVVVDPSTGLASCRVNAGRLGATPCEQRQAGEWRFDESRWCEGCEYSFYVLVECGSEMHLPLRDVEGADIRVTNLLDPSSPPTLRCVNEAARGAAPALILRDVAGVPLDCCGGDGIPERWIGPAMDVTDSLGPGRVAWGLSEGCPTMAAHDAGADGLDCGDLPPGCGGLLDRVSPGEEQVIDCFVQADGGACGLYRVDVVSGGNAWSLFANCDGSAAPRFPIFFDCADAWAAFQPLPEIVLDEVRVEDACGAAVVEAVVRNAGCARADGDLAIALSWDPGGACGASEMREILAGPFPAGESRTLRVPLPAGCRPASLRARVDPDDAIPECSESGRTASCAIDAVSDERSAEGCACAASPPGVVGGDIARRRGDAVELSWEALPGATTYLVARGRLGEWTSHLVDAPGGAGTCDTGGRTVHLDGSPEGAGSYYLVAAVDACGRMGSLGMDALGRARSEPQGCR